MLVGEGKGAHKVESDLVGESRDEQILEHRKLEEHNQDILDLLSPLGFRSTQSLMPLDKPEFQKTMGKDEGKDLGCYD